MTKQEFVDQVADRAELSKKDAAAAVDAFLDTVEDALKRGDGIGINRAYTETVNSLKKSHGAIGRQVTAQYTDNKASADRLANVLSRNRKLNFKGYNHMVSAYFEALAKNESGQ